MFYCLQPGLFPGTMKAGTKLSDVAKCPGPPSLTLLMIAPYKAKGIAALLR